MESKDSPGTVLAPDEELSRLRGALDSIGEGFQIIGFDWRYLYVNTAVARHGRRPADELLGRTMMECYPGIDQTEMFRALARCMSERVPSSLENEFTYPDGKKAWFELRIQPCPEGICVFSVDVTERKRLESQLRQAQKMEGIGRLAGGVAHDFNNLLSVILSYSSLALRDLKPTDGARADIEEIEKAGQRAAELTRQLLAFSRPHASDQRIVSVNRVVADMHKLIQRLVGEDVTVRLALGTETGKVKMDPTHLEQVVMNLVVNARDAMPKGGVLTLETTNLHLDEGFARTHLGVTAGPHVMLAVSDTGIGMDRATQERIFEPFFTTKEKGTGLGLSTVFGIVKQAEGHIWVYSEPGQGTTFKVYLPRTDGEEMGATRRAAPRPMPQGTETILLCEDDEQVRGLAVDILRKHGYTVLDAHDAGHALDIARRHAEKIHLLLTDVVMPGMSGRKLADAVIRLRSGAKVLFMSGYTDDAMANHGVLEPGMTLLEKPITPEALLGKVRAVLDAAG